MFGPTGSLSPDCTRVSTADSEQLSTTDSVEPFVYFCFVFAIYPQGLRPSRRMIIVIISDVSNCKKPGQFHCILHQGVGSQESRKHIAQSTVPLSSRTFAGTHLFCIQPLLFSIFRLSSRPPTVSIYQIRSRFPQSYRTYTLKTPTSLRRTHTEKKALLPMPRVSHDSDHVLKDWKFWCIIFSLALSTLLTTVEFMSRPHSLIWTTLRQVASASRNSDSDVLRYMCRPRSELRFQRSYVTSRACNSSGSALCM